jgi:uncharacterized membrane protein HdeD (DUF308 family)
MEPVDPPQDDPLGEGLERIGRSPLLTIGAGALSIVIGVLALLLADSVEVIAWLFAILIAATGALQLIAAFAGDAGTGGRIFHAINDGPRGDRGWRIASGLLFVLGGAVVLIYPGASLATLIWLLGIVLLVTGVVLVAHGLFARRSTQPAAVVAAP